MGGKILCHTRVLEVASQQATQFVQGQQRFRYHPRGTGRPPQWVAAGWLCRLYPTGPQPRDKFAVKLAQLHAHQARQRRNECVPHSRVGNFCCNGGLQCPYEDIRTQGIKLGLHCAPAEQCADVGVKLRKHIVHSQRHLLLGSRNFDALVEVTIVKKT